ncbi:MAG: hypothetical protein QM809_18440 [Gordonia sp. (in: high G+C Gram-positive bacteria)]|uniref:hypothetical protein n=1 Tax=Gordonia sp. (in: high G+C Gram-positive bacteria) TaxID=84139 RepID=UPI0039E529C2
MEWDRSGRYATDPDLIDAAPGTFAWVPVGGVDGISETALENLPPPLQGTWGGKPPARRVVRLFPDYMRDYPLWESSTSTWNVGYTTGPELYGLSEELSGRLAAWQHEWETSICGLDREPSPEAVARWRAEGAELARLLGEAVADYADVEYLD